VGACCAASACRIVPQTVWSVREPCVLRLELDDWNKHPRGKTSTTRQPYHTNPQLQAR